MFSWRSSHRGRRFPQKMCFLIEVRAVPSRNPKGFEYETKLGCLKKWRKKSLTFVWHFAERLFFMLVFFFLQFCEACGGTHF